MEILKSEKVKVILTRIEQEIFTSFSISTLVEDFSIEDTSIIEATKTHLLTPTSDLMKRGGKRLRPLLLVLLTSMFAGQEDEAYLFAPIIEGIHTASLIHDDIEDNSQKRRGNPSIHIKYNLDVAINAASALYFFALHLIDKMPEKIQDLLYKRTLHAISSLHIGQAMDIKHHSNYNLDFNLSDYRNVASLKTGSLFTLATEAALIFSHKYKSDAREISLFRELGIIFQMLDDIKNISSGNKGKDRGDDVVEGKLSFPIILYLENNCNEKLKIMNLFERAKKEGIESQAVDECCKILEKTVEEGRNIIEKRTTEIFLELYKMHKGFSDIDIIKSLFSLQ